MPLILSPRFERRLEQMMRLRSNPPRRPEELAAVMQALSRWAKDESAFLSANTKTNKTDIGKMFLSSSMKLEKTVTDQNWVVRGLALVSADMLGKLAKEDPGKWGLTAEEAKRLRGVDFCPGASAGCKAVCLVNAGQMPMDSARGAQVRRSLAYIFNRPAFMLATIVGIAGFYRWAKHNDLRPAFRLNITSDLDWENKKVTMPEWLAAYLREGYGMTWVRAGTYRNLPELFAGPGAEPAVLFYDYTKVARRIQNMAFDKNWPKNYWLTWSLAETNDNRRTALWVLQNMVTSVTVPFDRRSGRKGRWESEPLPDTLSFRDTATGNLYPFPVINGDAHDLRFLDKYAMDRLGSGVIVGLHFKIPLAGETIGKSEKEKARMSSGFVVAAPTQNPIIDVDLSRTNPPRRSHRSRSR